VETGPPLRPDGTPRTVRMAERFTFTTQPEADAFVNHRRALTGWVPAGGLDPDVTDPEPPPGGRRVAESFGPDF
jgi:hypothetical protein